MSENGEKLIAEIRRLAAEEPTFVYAGPSEDDCVYLDNGGGSCIVGQALVNTGLIDPKNPPSTRDFPTIEGYPAKWLFDFQLEHLKVSPGEADWMNDVQNRQDNHWAWGDAVVWADDLAGTKRV